ncbi:acyl-CoA dehydrogenase family protein [Pseudomonas sp. LRF_L74]|uniref:acyl-CoA dehydrogenase family protein n=1 Tax=Pseudomonas sp. LRF_L74 TaxID=3369422 RepID=UPI003F6365CC
MSESNAMIGHWIEERSRQLAALAISDYRQRALRDEGDSFFPLENLRSIHDLGLLHITSSEINGGFDGHLLGARPGLFHRLLRLISRGDAATAHCFQLHNHSLWTLEGVATPEQIDRFVLPLTSRFGLAASVGSEPARIDPAQMQTRATRVPGGWRVSGTKSFVTNGEYADLIIAVVAIDGAQATAEHQMMLILEQGMPGLSWDDDWYRPNGMKLARSPLLRLDSVFVPDSHVLGKPGTYVREGWHERFHLGFAANYLGMVEGLFDWHLGYTLARQREHDEFVQLRTGEMRVRIDSAAALFEQAVLAWQQTDETRAGLLSMSAKAVAEQTALDVSRSIISISGGTAQFEEHPLGYFIRNIEMHCVHAGHDRTAQLIGRSSLLNNDFRL